MIEDEAVRQQVRLATVIALIEEVAFRRMDARVADWLLSHSGQGSAVVKVTHQEIATEPGTSREVVSRMLKDLESRGILQLSRGMDTINDARRLTPES